MKLKKKIFGQQFCAFKYLPIFHSAFGSSLLIASWKYEGKPGRTIIDNSAEVEVFLVLCCDLQVLYRILPNLS